MSAPDPLTQGEHFPNRNRKLTSKQPRRKSQAAEQVRYKLLIAILLITLFVSITLAVTIGPVPIPPLRVWQIAFSQILPNMQGDWSPAQVQIVWLIRFPRVLLAAFVGAGLSVVGVTLQALVRNPLADPYILGVSSGATVGAALVLVLGVFSSFGVYALSLGAFLGAFFAFAVVFLLAQHQGQLLPTRLILAGVAVSYLFSGITSFLALLGGSEGSTRRVLFWILGGLSGTKWTDLSLPMLALGVGLVYLVLQARSLNALLIGEETAITLGTNTDRFRKQLFLVTSLLTGVMVAVSGAIGFVGLMMPHIVRLFVGSDHRRVLPVSLLLGGIFLIWADVLARILVAPEELPIGIITSLFGTPFFLWLLRRQTNALGRSGR